jgi:succinyl-CoA synthetase beta subunit
MQKVTIDDNALYRHKDIAEMRDTREEMLQKWRQVKPV